MLLGHFTKGWAFIEKNREKDWGSNLLVKVKGVILFRNFLHSQSDLIFRKGESMIFKIWVLRCNISIIAKEWRRWWWLMEQCGYSYWASHESTRDSQLSTICTLRPLLYLLCIIKMDESFYYTLSFILTKCT